ncbi:MAG: hypothetical protein CMO55_00315 [Verrucomicrobiales bacterium]|nr:hypothetical protein [Verrucomicrobiales bacterium]
MTDEERDELLEMAHAYIERSLPPEKVEELEKLLASSAEARRIFLNFNHDHAVLHWEHVSSEGDDSESIGDDTYRPSRFPPLWQILAAGAVVSLLALLIIRPNASSEPTFATMASTESARWESGELPTSDGAKLPAGKLHLARGLATIEFDSGTTIVLEAPAQLELVDDRHCRLDAGTVVVEAPGRSAEFSLSTPTAEILNKSTHFAVNVHPGTGATQTQVFEGEVSVIPANGSDPLTLAKGQRSFLGGEGEGQITEGLEEETWAANAIPRDRPKGWQTITTSDGSGTDGYVYGGQPNNHVSDELLLLKNSIDLSGPHRKSYLRFDLSRIPKGAIQNAELSLRFAPTGWGLASHLNDSEFEVYGIIDDSLDSWDYETMDWENAPANVTDSGTALLPAATIYLGKFDLPRGIQSGSYGIRGDRLVDFLNRDLNRQATLVIVRTTVENRGGGLVHAIASKRHPTLPAPSLAVKVVE